MQRALVCFWELYFLHLLHHGMTAFDDLDAPPAVVASKNWITPAHELEDAFFPQASWILDTIDAKIVPLPGHVRVTNQSKEEKLRNEKRGV